MQDSPVRTADRSVRRLMVLGAAFIFLFGSLMHFVFEWSGRSPAVGVLVPLNESVWEHVKLAYLPTLAWYLISHAISRRREPRSLIRWLLAASVALLVSHLFIIVAYYTASGAFDLHSLLLDVFIFLVAIILGQVLAQHVFRHATLGWFGRTFAVAFPLFLLAAYVVFAFATPRLPLFLDQPTGTYGFWMDS